MSATSPGPAQPLLGARLFHLPAPSTADLLALLHHAHPTTGHNPSTGKAAGRQDGTALEVTALPSPTDPAPDPATHT